MEILVRAVRKEKNLTIVQLAELSGVSKSHISEIETGKQMPTIDVLCRLADALEVEPAALFKHEKKIPL